jgi:hypothetical protein
MANHLAPSAPEREGVLRPPARDSQAPSADGGVDVHPVLTLQRQVGNAQIQRLLAQREAPEEEELQAKRDPTAIQREAAPEEEELQAKRDPSAIQREAPEEEEELQAKRDETVQRESAPEEEEEQLQGKRDGVGAVVGPEGGPVTDEIQSRIQSKRGSGSALDGGTQATMEGSLGESFDDVRVHRDSESDSLNRSLGAKAFTTGSDIFFRQDTSPSDHSLLGHELTHVVQQRNGEVGGGGGMRVGPANDAFESAADSAGSLVASGGVVAQKKPDHE